jgi:hypothetical protein
MTSSLEFLVQIVVQTVGEVWLERRHQHPVHRLFASLRIWGFPPAHRFWRIVAFQLSFFPDVQPVHLKLLLQLLHDIRPMLAAPLFAIA